MIMINKLVDLLINICLQPYVKIITAGFALYVIIKAGKYIYFRFRRKQRQIEQTYIDKLNDTITNQNVTIVWFFEKIDIQIEKDIKKVHDHCILCTTINELTKSIDKYKNNKIILIVCGQYSRDILKEFHNHENKDKIYSFYIFCRNKQLYQDLVDDNKYSKLMDIYVEYKDLFEALQNELCLLLKHLSIFNLFVKNSKSIRDLKDESVDYLWYQLLRDTLMNTDVLGSKQEMIDYCRLYYHKDSGILKKIDEFELSYHSSDDIRGYSKNSMLSRMMDQELRSSHHIDIFKDLEESHEMNRVNSENSSSS
ncbi:unnamed protein product [Didymodactylos carnosus]|uniref:Uncharacterized protein n=1 Tax=Didymodactylos carnosus TaxID=1234261 RepID=A0A815RJ06_9BILA|nr:unnamed protein product [Didymodactylos carnosus]CAF4343878.1 unnamed protein product [Didymodactylos carnosus]